MSLSRPSAPFRCLAPALLLACLLASASRPAAADPLFAAPFLSINGAGGNDMAMADLNGDGKLDLVTTKNNPGTVSVLLGAGDGTFGTPTAYATGDVPRQVVIGDVNGDGKPDLVTANQSSSTISVLLGNGDGTFQPKQDAFTNQSPYSVAIGDVDGDGKPDLVATSAAQNKVAVLHGFGDGGFTFVSSYLAGNFFVAISDLNGDGKLDLVVVYRVYEGGSLYVLLGNGDGSFGAKTFVPYAGYPYRVAVGDLNGDGKPDLAIANGWGAFSNRITVLLGNGNGTFGPPQLDYISGTDPYDVEIGDVNGDGKPDLVAANQVDNTVSVLPGNGNGTFGAATSFVTGSNPSKVAIGDVNGDGSPDLAVLTSPLKFAVHIGHGDGSFGIRAFPCGGAVSLKTADLNADGKRDVVTANAGSNTASVLLGDGAGRLGAATNYSTGFDAEAVAIGDLNGDGKPDQVVVNAYNTNSVSVRPGNGDGTFGARTDFGTGTSPSSVAIGDLNGDGKPDLVTGNGQGVVTKSASVLLGNGDGTFAPKVDYGLPGQYDVAPVAVAIADLNADGKLDLATTNGVSTVSVFLGNGDGTLGSRLDLAAPSEPGSVAIADLNADGKLDVAVASYTAYVSVFLGQGDGTFGARTDFPVGTTPRTVVIGDLDGDGRPDLVTANNGSNSVSVLLGIGDGTFGPRTDYGVGISPRDVAIGDMDGDGAPDLAVAVGSVLVMHNIRGLAGVDPHSPPRSDLAPPRPNPFRGFAAFDFAVSRPGRVRLAVFDLSGRRIQTLQDGVLEPGRYTRSWDGVTASGTQAPMGVYLVRYAAPGIVRTTRAVLLR